MKVETGQEKASFGFNRMTFERHVVELRGKCLMWKEGMPSKLHRGRSREFLCEKLGAINEPDALPRSLTHAKNQGVPGGYDQE